MRKSTEIRAALKAQRERLDELLQVDSRTAVQTAEANRMYLDIMAGDALLLAAEREEEAELARIAGEPAASGPEDIEFRALRSRANLGRAVMNALAGISPTGAEAELAQHRGIGDNRIPLDLFAAAVTVPASGSGQETNTAGILPQLFESPVSRFLGVERPRVGVGEASYPIIGTGSTIEQPGQGVAVTESSPAVSVKTATPKRVTGQIRFQVEDAALLPNMEEALRRNLSEAIADGLEKQVVQALQSADVSSAPTAEGTTNTFKTFRAKLLALLDGPHASRVGDLRTLVNFHSLQALEALEFATATNPAGASYTAADWMREHGGGVIGSVHMSAHSSNVSEFNVMLGMHRGSLLQPLWEGVRVIRDELTDAGKGEVLITALVLQDTVVARAAAFSRQSVKTA